MTIIRNHEEHTAYDTTALFFGCDKITPLQMYSKWRWHFDRWGGEHHYSVYHMTFLVTYCNFAYYSWKRCTVPISSWNLFAFLHSKSCVLSLLDRNVTANLAWLKNLEPQEKSDIYECSGATLVQLAKETEYLSLTNHFRIFHSLQQRRRFNLTPFLSSRFLV